MKGGVLSHFLFPGIPTLFLLIWGVSLSAQSSNGALQGYWQFSSVKSSNGKKLLPVKKGDFFNLRRDRTFHYELAAKNNLVASGNYTYRNDSLLLNYTLPEDTLRYYQIRELTDSTLSFVESGVRYSFTRSARDSASSSFSEKQGNNPTSELPLNYDFADAEFQWKNIWRGALGLLALLFLAFLMSSDRRQINWVQVGKGMLIQLLFALAILKLPWARSAFDGLSSLFVTLLGFTEEGSKFVFGDLVTDTESFGYIFAFQVLPTILFFSALTSLLFYYGILQKVVYGFAWIMKRSLRLSGAESLAAAGNIFLGQTESPLLVKPYIEKMTRSELLCLMSGGMATIAGGVLAAYIGFLGGSDPLQQAFFAKHLLAASVMSAPAAVVAAKILVPETQKVDDIMKIEQSRQGNNALEALTTGTSDGLRLAVNVGAMLLVFIALIALVNALLLNGLGSWTGLNSWIQDFTQGQYDGLSLQFILGYSLAPLTWLMGVAPEDIVLVGQLLGEKTILNEFVAYVSLGDLLEQGQFSSEKSIIIATYILCGFANFGSIGIQIGGISSLAPSRRKDLSQLGFKALIAGTLASLFTAVVVGMLI